MRQLGVVFGVVVTAAMVGAPTSAAAPSWPEFDYTREVWQDGVQRQLFIRLGAPNPACATAPPGPDSIFLVAAVDESQPQGTSVLVDLGPPAGVVFAEPQHDDVVPASITGYGARAEACGFVLAPAASASDDVLSRPGDPRWAQGPAEWAWAVRFDPAGAHEPLDDTATALAALAAGLVEAVPIGSGGTAWTAACTQEGTPGDDILVGTHGPDVLCGLGGRDVLVGRGGDDVLLGSAGPDVAIGGDGADLVVGGYGDDVVEGGAGHDRLFGGWGTVPGADPSTVFPPPDPAMPSDGADRVLGGGGDDVLDGGYGPDFLLGGAGADRATGGFGTDRCVDAGTAGDC